MKKLKKIVIILFIINVILFIWLILTKAVPVPTKEEFLQNKKEEMSRESL